MSVAGLLLAAGGGSRFGGSTHKLLALYQGRPVVVSCLEAVAGAGFDATAVVVGAADLGGLVPSGIEVLENREWESGLASSLRVGLAWCEAAGHDAVVIGLGDTPGIPSSAWRSVAATNAEVAVASFAGAKRPPVRLSAAMFDQVPREGDVGARALWQRPDAVVVECEGDPSDIDTREDLEALEAKER